MKLHGKQAAVLCHTFNELGDSLNCHLVTNVIRCVK